MKKKLLVGALALLMGSSAMAQTQIEFPFLEWGFYACISKVEINGMVSEFPTAPEGWSGEIGKNSYDEATQYGDLTLDNTKLVQLEKGKTYDLDVTVCNFSSGEDDPYYVTVYFDWNNDYTLTKAETVGQEEIVLGAPGQDSFTTSNFKITVPADAAENATMRVYLHYRTNEVPYLPNDPLCDQDSGMLKDYAVEISSSTGIEDVKSNDLVVYPTVTDGLVNIAAEGANEYMLFSTDGRLVQKGMIENGTINMSGNQAGMYFLKIQTVNGVENANIILK